MVNVVYERPSEDSKSSEDSIFDSNSGSNAYAWPKSSNDSSNASSRMRRIESAMKDEGSVVDWKMFKREEPEEESKEAPPSVRSRLLFKSKDEKVVYLRAKLIDVEAKARR